MTVELPKDAEGREIQLDTKVLFDKDGKELRVKRIEFDPFNDVWRFVVQKGSLDLGAFYYRPEYVCLEKPITPDSWEKLLDDLDRALSTPGPDTYASITCGYFDSANVNCSVCEYMHGIKNETCNDDAWKDIASRIRKLAAKEG